jgi:hypothetical protein
VIVCVAFGAGIPKETKLKPTAVFAGSHSAIRYETFNVITKEEGWQRLWKEHRGAKHDPEFTETEQELDIDFDTHYVVAVFAGVDWCEITPRLRGDVVVIGFRGVVNQTEGRLPQRSGHEEAKDAAKAPYAFVVLPKPVKTVVIEEDVRYRLDKPPIWEHRFLFPAPKDAK